MVSSRILCFFLLQSVRAACTGNATSCKASPGSEAVQLVQHRATTIDGKGKTEEHGAMHLISPSTVQEEAARGGGARGGSSRTAICITGAVRTFAQEEVYKSIQQNLVNVLRQQGHVAVFMYLKKHDVANDGQTVCPDAAEAALSTAIQTLAPSVVEFGDGVDPMKKECKTKSPQTAESAWHSIQGAVNQVFMNYMCAQFIEGDEQKTHSPFTHVVKMRCDMRWSHATATLASWPQEGARLHDKIYFLPRDHLQAVLRRPYEKYTGCTNTSLNYAEDPGFWAYRLMDEAQREAGLPLTKFDVKRPALNTLDATTSHALFPAEIFRC